MGEVDLNVAEVTLFVNEKKQIKRLNGSYEEALSLAKHAKVMLSDGSEYFFELRLVPPDIFPQNANEPLIYEHVFLEGAGVFDDGQGAVVHEKRSYI